MNTRKLFALCLSLTSCLSMAAGAVTDFAWGDCMHVALNGIAVLT